MDRPKAVAIMCETGGPAIGFEAAGIDVIGFLEVNSWLAEACHLNWPGKEHVPEEEWDRALEAFIKEHPQIVFGQPPCQGVSGANKQASGNNPKNQRFVQALDVALKLEPEYVVLENIPRLLGMAGHIVGEAEELGAKRGYTLSVHKHRAGDFGVSQGRARVMFVWSKGPPPDFRLEKLRPATVAEAISDFYELEPNDDGSRVKYPEPAKSDYQERMRRGPKGGKARGTWNHMRVGRVPDHWSKIPQGSWWAALPEEDLTDEEWDKLENHRIFNAAEPRKLREDAPASTVTGMRNKIHPTLNRYTTVRENARFMGFPDWWRLPNSHNLQQLAAGVCPPVGEAFGRELVRNLNGSVESEPTLGRLF